MATYKDQFFVIDPSSPPGVGTPLNFVRYTLTDANNDNDFDRFNNDLINGSDITSSYPGDTVTINVPGVGNVTYTGTTFYLANGQTVFTPNTGQVLQNGTFVSSTWVNTQGPLLVNQLGPACFCQGTLLRLPGGVAAIETLVPGDRVETMDHGAQTVRWVGRQTVAGGGDFAPVRFETGTIGNDRPLTVSPQHRVMLAGAWADLLFAEPEVLVPARHLVGLCGVSRVPMAKVTYLHLLFDRHEIVFSEGAPTESFHPGSQLLDGDRALRAEIAAIFPDCPGLRRGAAVPVARPVLAGYEARLLAA